MMPERLLGSGDGITTRSNRGALGGLSPEMFRRKFQPTTGHGPNSAVAYGGDRPVSRSKTKSTQKTKTTHLLPRGNMIIIQKVLLLLTTKEEQQTAYFFARVAPRMSS